MKNLPPVGTANSSEIQSHMPLKENELPNPSLPAVQETQSSCQETLGKSFLKEVLWNTVFNSFFFRDTQQ